MKRTREDSLVYCALETHFRLGHFKAIVAAQIGHASSHNNYWVFLYKRCARRNSSANLTGDASLPCQLLGCWAVTSVSQEFNFEQLNLQTLWNIKKARL
jgi:hypothetical protein